MQWLLQTQSPSANNKDLEDLYSWSGGKSPSEKSPHLPTMSTPICSPSFLREVRGEMKYELTRYFLYIYRNMNGKRKIQKWRNCRILWEKSWMQQPRIFCQSMVQDSSDHPSLPQGSGKQGGKKEKWMNEYFQKLARCWEGIYLSIYQIIIIMWWSYLA